MLKILVIEDDFFSRFTTKRILSAFNLQIIEAQDGLEGMNLFVKEKPDLVLLDLYLPYKSGFDLLKEMQEELLDIPVVIMSADNSQKTIYSCLSNGAFAFLPKPIVKEDFNEIIIDLMSDKVINNIY